MDKEELMKINKEYIDHLKAMESLAERMDRTICIWTTLDCFVFLEKTNLVPLRCS